MSEQDWKKAYRNALSSPVDPELIRRTAQQMKSMPAGFPKGRKPVYARRNLSMAAAFALVLMIGVFCYTSMARRENLAFDAASANPLAAQSPQEEEEGLSINTTVASQSLQTEKSGLPEDIRSDEELPLVERALYVNSAGIAYAYSADELVDPAAPWDADQIEQPATLSVYRNLVPVDYQYVPLDETYACTEEEMEQIAEKMADTLEWELEPARESESTHILQDGGPYLTLYARTTTLGQSILVNRRGDCWIAVAGESADGLSQDTEMDQGSAGYLSALCAASDMYAGLLGSEYLSFTDPVYSERLYYLEDGSSYVETGYYDQSGTLEEQILKYSFQLYAEPFQLSAGSGEVETIFVPSGQSVEFLGDYPALSVQEAQEYLQKGLYQSNCPFEPEDFSVTAGVELVYQADQSAGYFLPYYRFYIPLSSQLTGMELPEGLEAYGAFLVPAIPDEYLY